MPPLASPSQTRGGQRRGEGGPGGGASAFLGSLPAADAWSHPTNTQRTGASPVSQPKVRAEGHLSTIIHEVLLGRRNLCSHPPPVGGQEASEPINAASPLPAHPFSPAAGVLPLTPRELSSKWLLPPSSLPLVTHTLSHLRAAPLPPPLPLPLPLSPESCSTVSPSHSEPRRQTRPGRWEASL